ncbi:hypothetical protein GGS23DRAFT_553421 [Durotheca rogersii]|uniref:uncharacterized protein n=1 Tax=Durotheca rogersii TaxID=419775 RepID=UPI0022207654|nr:uncharacterized protein GGS23DRAFT_553421 [Durotheca rogersii]KAI5867077.1 hypothetical protein GGS23DRAFT_553421 [Durotheca rogersii]
MAQAVKTSAPAGPAAESSGPFVSQWSSRYRGATVQDLEPPAALTLTPTDAISVALQSAFERDYTHLAVVDGADRSALLGYVAIPALRAALDAGAVRPADPVARAMARFQRRGRPYRVITPATPLEDLEAFFDGRDPGRGPHAEPRDFAIVTDDDRRFVLGVATRADLEEFVKRRPA